MSQKKTPHSIGWGDDIAHIAQIPGVPQFHGDVRVGVCEASWDKKMMDFRYPKNKKGDMLMDM